MRRSPSSVSSTTSIPPSTGATSSSSRSRVTGASTFQCRPDDDAEAFSGTAGVARWLPKVMDARYAERVTWVSTYVFLQVLAREFVDPARRVLLVGEAAHLFAPFGARGLNSGIPDAIVAARAIRGALAAGSQAEARAAVDHFADSRRAAAARNREASNTALAHLSATSPLADDAPPRRRARRAPRDLGCALARRGAVRPAARAARHWTGCGTSSSAGRTDRRVCQDARWASPSSPKRSTTLRSRGSATWSRGLSVLFGRRSPSESGPTT